MEPQFRTNETVTMPKGGVMHKQDKMGWTTVDEPGVPFLANKMDLDVDMTYQRSMVSQARVMEIARQWSYVACGSIICAERADGKLYVIDGQHRVLASLKRSDIVELPCLVFKSKGSDQEAHAFFRANCTRGNVSPYDKLRALLAAGDKLSRDAVTLMDEQGYKPSGSGGGPNSVKCISTFVAAMRSNPNVLRRVWPLIAKLHDGIGIKKTVFDAIIYIGKFGSEDIASTDWERRILKQGLHRIESNIDRAIMLLQRSNPKLVAQAALEVINKGVSSSKRIELSESAQEE